MNNEDASSNEESAGIDWDQVHRRLDEAKTSSERSFSILDPEEKIKILKERAKRLSREAERIEEEKDRLEVVEFVLAYENYAIESEYVSEVYPLKEFTPLPCTPDFVLGIINVRGRIISIVDLKKFFDLPEKGIADLNRIIIIQSDQNELGILADSISGVRSIPIDEIQSSLPTLTGIREEYLKGVVGDRIVVLDAARILSDRKIIVHEEVV